MMNIMGPPFNFASIPHIIFGSGALTQLFDIMPRYGRNILFVIGEKSLKRYGKWDEIIKILES